jgi:phosphoglycolate phosphatase
MSLIDSTRRAVLLDLDGTLVDSAPDLAAAVNRMLADFGTAPLPLATVRSFIGHGIASLVHRVLVASKGLHIDESNALARFHRHYTACNGKHSRVYPGVLEGIAELRRQGYLLACVTNKLHPYTTALLEAKGLAPLLDAVVCAGDAMPGKPDAAPLLHACRLLDVDPSCAVMVGDSEVDATAARRADMPVYLVRYGYHQEGGFTVLRCNAFLNSISELPALLACTENAG